MFLKYNYITKFKPIGFSSDTIFEKSWQGALTRDFDVTHRRPKLMIRVVFLPFFPSPKRNVERNVKRDVARRSDWSRITSYLAILNHPARGDYKTLQYCSTKMAAARFLDVFKEETSKIKDNAVTLIIT